MAGIIKIKDVMDSTLNQLMLEMKEPAFAVSKTLNAHCVGEFLVKVLYLPVDLIELSLVMPAEMPTEYLNVIRSTTSYQVVWQPP